jgi:hypothetical protein
LRPDHPDRAFDMVGLAFETHVAATSKVDPGNNHDPAMMQRSVR